MNNLFALLLKKKGITKIDVLILFGSYSKGTERKESDIDILGVSENKEETEREIRSFKYSTGKDFSPVTIPRVEFPKIKKENPELWNDIIKNGIIFKGVETVYFIEYENESS